MNNELIIVGVNIAGLANLGFIAVRFVLKQVWALVIEQQKTISNHLDHNTKVLTELRDAVRELTSVLRDKTISIVQPPPPRE